MSIGSIESSGSGLRTFTGIASIPILVVGLALTNLIQVSGFLIYPFSRRLSRQIACQAAAYWLNFILWVGIELQGAQIAVTGDPIPPSENAVLISNHQGMADIFYIFYL